MLNIEDDLQQFRNVTGSKWSVIYRPSRLLQFTLNDPNVVSNLVQSLSTLRTIPTQGKV
jgi:hypothetical protein